MLLGELTNRKRLIGLISSNKEVLLAVIANIIPRKVYVGRCLGNKSLVCAVDLISDQQSRPS